MKEKKRKYLVFGQSVDDRKPFICYGIHENLESYTLDTAACNCMTGANCLMTKKEAIAHRDNLQKGFPEFSYAVKKFL